MVGGARDAEKSRARMHQELAAQPKISQLIRIKTALGVQCIF
jgi:hypothetical protein